jgi:uncharacterized membrane protein HdeD (DUF308 family)
MNFILGARALLSIGVGILITFSQSHGAAVGLLALTIFGLGFAVFTAVAAATTKDQVASIESVPITIAALIVGVLALLVLTQNPDAGAGTFISLITGWGLISGAFELFLARRAGFKKPAGRDFLITSILSLALGVLFLVAPLDIVSAVGFFGAYLVVVGVHLGISATTPKTKGKSGKNSSASKSEKGANSKKSKS